jgi:hypothetical protein
MKNLENFGHREDLHFGFQSLKDWKSWKFEFSSGPLVNRSHRLTGRPIAGLAHARQLLATRQGPELRQSRAPPACPYPPRAWAPKRRLTSSLPSPISASPSAFPHRAQLECAAHLCSLQPPPPVSCHLKPPVLSPTCALERLQLCRPLALLAAPGWRPPGDASRLWYPSPSGISPRTGRLRHQITRSPPPPAPHRCPAAHRHLLLCQRPPLRWASFLPNPPPPNQSTALLWSS